MTFEYTNNIKCTKEEAWKLITEIERRPDWIHFMDKCVWLDKKPGIVGSTYNEEEIFLYVLCEGLKSGNDLSNSSCDHVYI